MTESFLDACTGFVALCDSEESLAHRSLPRCSQLCLILSCKDSSFSPFAKASAGQATQNDRVAAGRCAEWQSHLSAFTAHCSTHADS
ncbi:MAG: hypothetical protein WDA68_03245 [Phycisphaerae bacterium]